MRILYVAHRIPYPPDKGDKIRSFHQVQYLARRNEIWCAFFVDRPEDMKYVQVLRQWCAFVAPIPFMRSKAAILGVAGLLWNATATECYYQSKLMARILRQWSAQTEFDAALFFSSGMAQYRDCVTSQRAVLDFCDWDSLKWSDYARHAQGLKSLLCNIEAGRLRKREAKWIGQLDASVVITDRERTDAPPSVDRERIHVVGNGVDAGPEPTMPACDAPPRIGFVGQMDYPPNVDAVCRFATDVFPIIKREVPAAEFVIIGRAPSRPVRYLQRRPGVHVTGWVECVRHEIEQLAASVAPLRMGRGLQNKVLEAMAAARPVVASPLATRGIDADPGRHLLVADDPDSFARDVINLLRHPARRSEIGQAARCHVMRRYDWERELAKLETLLRGDAIDAQRPRAASREAALV